MPLSNDEIVNEINDLYVETMRFRPNDGAPVLTIPWPDFYKLCDMARFKAPRPEQIQRGVMDQFGLIVAYGDRVVLVAQDRNFAPAPRERG